MFFALVLCLLCLLWLAVFAAIVKGKIGWLSGGAMAGVLPQLQLVRGDGWSALVIRSLQFHPVGTAIAGEPRRR
jgi:hypothetical protein